MSIVPRTGLPNGSAGDAQHAVRRAQPCPRLTPHDAQVLASRAISPAIAEARGYRSISGAEAKDNGFPPLAGLLIPSHNTAGEIARYQLRPHIPPFDRDTGKPRKYLWPTGSRQSIDVPPPSLPALRDVEAPLIITEAPLKADAIVSALDAAGMKGVAVIAVAGVFGWRSDGMPLSDHQDIPWRHKRGERIRRRRAVYLAFDSDAATNPNVCRARWEYAEYLRRRGAAVQYIDIPPDDDGGKRGIDDALAAGHDLRALIQSASPAPDTLPAIEPTTATADDHPLPRPAIISADMLMGKQFPEPRWAVQDLFPEGLSIFAGPPKIGKSWLCLNVAVAVAAGGVAIGKIPVADGDVLYIALEDTERRLQERLVLTLQGEAAPSRLHLATTWPTLADGAAAHLRQWLLEHRDARLVVVDTFQKLRGPVSANQNLYAGDYAAAGELKRVADDSGVALVVIHHTRKATADDPLDMVSGTAGLAGAADTTLVLRKEIGRSDANLYIRGRDVPEADHALTFGPESCSWCLLGDAAIYRRSQERQAIIALLADSPEPMRPKAIAEALGKKDGAVRFLLHKMTKDGEIDGLGGSYHLPLTPANSANATNTGPETPVIPGNPAVSGAGGLANAPLTVAHPERRGNALPVGGVSGVSGSDIDRDIAHVSDSWGSGPVDGEAGHDRWTA